MILRIDADEYTEGSGVDWEVQMAPDRAIYVRSGPAAGFPLAKYASRCVAAYNYFETAEAGPDVPPEVKGVVEVRDNAGRLLFRFDVHFISYRMTPKGETLRLEIVAVTQGAGGV